VVARSALPPHDFTVCLLTENLTDLNRQLVQSPHTSEIFIPMPDENERKTFVRWNVGGRQADFKQLADVSLDALARNTAGLNFIQLRTIVADVLENRARLTFERLSQLKKEFIEAEAYGLIEFIETDFTLDSVAGHTYAKQHLREASRAIRNGRPDVLPMGYLVSGPVGTGKTFLISCFAGEIGIPMVKLKNFRSQWQGVTEGNLEKILHLLEAMTPVAVMIDEADAALGNRDAQGDSGVSARVFAQIASFMSTPSHRGKVIFFLVTARPDLMPVDLKRQGRAEEHIALFYPSSREEREELLTVMLRRTGVSLEMSDVPEALLNGERTLSGADMEALLTRAKFRAATATEAGEVTATVLQEAVDDFIPPTYPLEVELTDARGRDRVYESLIAARAVPGHEQRSGGPPRGRAEAAGSRRVIFTYAKPGKQNGDTLPDAAAMLARWLGHFFPFRPVSLPCVREVSLRSRSYRS
jgi:SpoVK/Ycf46/Vps4 family AAA+-type ATPase